MTETKVPFPERGSIKGDPLAGGLMKSSGVDIQSLKLPRAQMGKYITTHQGGKFMKEKPLTVEVSCL